MVIGCCGRSCFLVGMRMAIFVKGESGRVGAVLTLVLMRHAHTESGSDDRQRRLTPAGEAAARSRGGELAEVVRPDHVLCSTAVRAVR